MVNCHVLFICLTAAAVSAQVVSNVRLVDHQAYYIQLITEVMHEAERREWCNLKLPDFTQVIDSTIYGWHINGSVTYKNGFLHSIQSMDLREDSVTQVWTHNTADDTSTVALRGTLRLHDMALAYDVEVALEGEPLQHFTGIYTHEIVQFATALRKVVQTDVLTAAVEVSNLSAGNTRRMIYMPETNVTQVLQRQYLPSQAFNGINDWGFDILAPIMLEKATSVLQYPALCYNCNI